MNKETYDILVTEKMIPLGIFADEINVDGKIKVSSEISMELASNENHEPIHVKKVHHQGKYTKRQYVYKKKNKRRRK